MDFPGARGLVVALAAWVLVLQPERCSAEDAVEFPLSYPQYEVTAGAEAASHSWSVWGGATFAPFGDVRVDGFRIRSSTGIGFYTYNGSRWNGVERLPATFQGRYSSIELLLGWQAALGPVIVKAFAGGIQEAHDIRPFDYAGRVQGDYVGAKVALETWLGLSDWGFIQTDFSWSQPLGAHSVRLRAGYRATPFWSVGLEGALVGNADNESGRAGLFTRLEAPIGEMSISGGMAGEGDASSAVYATVGLLWRF